MIRILIEAPEAVDPSKYSNTDFKPYVVGNSNPLGDKINPSLLKDIDTAARNAGIKVSITTAVTGHKRGTRHETGHAVDIAIVNGKGYGSEDDAKQKGIHDDIMKFIDQLKSMGYVKNSESGNDKAVLTFGFPNHHHHVHVSRKSDDGGSEYVQTSTTGTTTGSTQSEYPNIDTSSGSDSSSGEHTSFLRSMLNSALKESKQKNKVINEINRIKQLL